MNEQLIFLIRLNVLSIVIVFILLISLGIKKLSKINQKRYNIFIENLIPGIAAGIVVFIATRIDDFITPTSTISMFIELAVIIFVSLLVLSIFVYLYVRKVKIEKD